MLIEVKKEKNLDVNIILKKIPNHPYKSYDTQIWDMHVKPIPIIAEKIANYYSSIKITVDSNLNCVCAYLFFAEFTTLQGTGIQFK